MTRSNAATWKCDDACKAHAAQFCQQDGRSAYYTTRIRNRIPDPSDYEAQAPQHAASSNVGAGFHEQNHEYNGIYRFALDVRPTE